MKLVAVGAKILFSRVGQVLANAVVIFMVAKTLGPEGQGHYSLTVALAMLLAGPALSLPNMLVIRSVMGTKKTLVFVALVIVMASISGIIFGAFWG